MKINKNIYELTPEIYNALSDTGYTGRNMRIESHILNMNNIIRDLGYTGDDDRNSKRKKNLSQKLFQNSLRIFKTKLLKKLQTTLRIYKEKELKLLYHLT